MAKRIEKANLPQKPCQACGRPFTWRKKWARVWDEVKFCSERCRREPHAGKREAS
ncbi:DUF2256 domain-containing protein [Bosea sp. (in: a-proteobacteria)]|uniref:DUF2256 domain-containing protein n=1 Tax=Bosea sp. (in: a-proteobacteria) TaxID=1871050 RepID=UPI0027337E4B|nr:DUF2256 domain-containing protein [Bosea sp. (in: a-proteobacteria)]MDP3410890.1 DUF2256 domain-containing protein [Bosea sp. (in: a-proteobacteria)]